MHFTIIHFGVDSFFCVVDGKMISHQSADMHVSLVFSSPQNVSSRWNNKGNQKVNIRTDDIDFFCAAVLFKLIQQNKLSRTIIKSIGRCDIF